MGSEMLSAASDKLQNEHSKGTSKAMLEIKLTRGFVAWVDDCDHSLSARRWFTVVTPRAAYAARHDPEKNKRFIYMHRAIMQPPAGMQVSHELVDRGIVDNRRQNLRIATPSQQIQNTRKRRNTSSQYKGVYWSTKDKTWISAIQLSGEKITLGYFKIELEAAKAYDAAARELFGEFARYNLPESMP